MRRFFLLLLCLMLLAPAALAEKTVTLTFTGDVTLGSEEAKRRYAYSLDSVAAAEGYEYFFANVRDFFAEDDLTVVNFEGVLSDSNRQENTSKTYRFRGPTEFVEILNLASVEAANIANNHTMDFGTQGYTATKETLSSAGIGYFGNQSEYIFEKDGIRIAFLGLNSTALNKNKSWIKEEIPRLKEEEGINAVVFTIHAGQEYGKHRNNTQETFGHYVIDAGADLVIMHHPHVVQGIEVYQNRYICYSLGNFCFGGNKTVRAMETVVARVVLSFDDSGAYTGQQLSLYPAHISGTDPDNNYQPLFVSGDDAAEVMRLIQIDTDFDLNPYDEELGCAPQAYLPAN